jgi:hypothetical protein
LQTAKASFQNSMSLIGSVAGQNPQKQSVKLLAKPAKLQKPGRIRHSSFRDNKADTLKRFLNQIFSSSSLNVANSESQFSKLD